MVHFQGLHSLTLDEKGRIAIPSRYRSIFRTDIADSLVVTIDLSGHCLWLYPYAHWEVIAAKMQTLPSLDSEVMRLQRLLLGHASEVEIDNQGRLLIPSVLRECAQLSKNLILMGQGKRFELWDAKILEKQRKSWLVNTDNTAGLAQEIREIIL